MVTALLLCSENIYSILLTFPEQFFFLGNKKYTGVKKKAWSTSHESNSHAPVDRYR